MRKYRHICLKERLILGFWGVLLLLPLSLRAQERVKPELLEMFQRRDNHQLLSDEHLQRSSVYGFEVSFSMRRVPPLAPEKGEEITTYTIVWTADWQVMKGTIHYEQPPGYPLSGTRSFHNRGYDQEDDVIVWRPVERYHVFTREQNEGIEQLLSYRVSPDGTIEAQRASPYTIRSLYRAGASKEIESFRQFRLATGRGFARYFPEVASPKPAILPSGLRELELSGSYASGAFQGTWTIQYDQDNDYLIRKGDFVPHGSTSPLFTVENSGLIECPGLSIASSGVYTYGDFYQATFEVLQLKSMARSQAEAHPVYKEVFERMTTPLPKGNAEIIDHRGEKPERIFIDE